MDDRAREATYRLLHEVITEQHRRLADSARALETRAALLAGFAAAALSFLLDRPGGVVWWCAVGAHGVALGLALAALWPARARVPVARRLHDRLRDAPLAVAVAMVTGWEAREADVSGWRLRAGTTLWCTAAVALVVGLVLSVWVTVEVAR